MLYGDFFTIWKFFTICAILMFFKLSSLSLLGLEFKETVDLLTQLIRAIHRPKIKQKDYGKHARGFSHQPTIEWLCP